jgi:HEAT repeat protein
MPLDRDELLELKAHLRSADPAVRTAAIEHAAEVVGHTITAVVAEALDSDNPEVRARALALLDVARPEPEA